MTGRSIPDEANKYRFGFNGKENDDNKEWGQSLVQDYGFRLYNPAIAKFLSVDPLAKSYPELTPYQFASNRPIDGIDIDGLEWGPASWIETWEPLTSKNIWDVAGPYKAKLRLEFKNNKLARKSIEKDFVQNVLASAIEQSAIGSMGYQNTKKTVSGIPNGKHKTHESDGSSSSTGFNGKNYSFFSIPTLFEVKLRTGNGPTVEYSNQAQAYINHIAKDNPDNQKAALGALIYITLADTEVSEKILGEASKLNVPVYQGTIDINSEGDIRVGHFRLLNAEQLNVEAQTLIPDLYKKPLFEKATERHNSVERDNLNTRLEAQTNRKIESLRKKFNP